MMEKVIEGLQEMEEMIKGMQERIEQLEKENKELQEKVKKLEVKNLAQEEKVEETYKSGETKPNLMPKRKPRKKKEKETKLVTDKNAIMVVVNGEIKELQEDFNMDDIEGIYVKYRPTDGKKIKEEYMAFKDIVNFTQQKKDCVERMLREKLNKKNKRVYFSDLNFALMSGTTQKEWEEMIEIKAEEDKKKWEWIDKSK